MEPHTVLVVDDNPANLRVVVSHLQAYGLEAITARDGEAGLERARRGRPSLILLDIEMPGIDGYETCRRLKSDAATVEVPVVFMTVRAETEDKVRGFDLGAVDYLTKPIDARELLARVRTHLELQGLRARLAAQNEALEERIAERTRALERELAQSEQLRREREQLLEMVRAQSDVMRGLTRDWLEARRARDQGLSTTLKERVSARLGLVHTHLAQARRLIGEAAARAEVEAHLDTAMALLEPAADSAASVEGHLDDDAEGSPLLALSARENEVLDLLVDGSSTKEIAWSLGIARTTVSTYRARLMEKLGVDNVPALIRTVLTLRDAR